MDLEEILALGGPFKLVQIEVSMKKKVARIVIPRQGQWPSLDIDFADDDKAKEAAEVAAELVAAGVHLGLLAKKNLQVAIVDLDMEVEN